MTSLAVTDTGTAYPSGRRARDRFVLARRPSRRPLDPLAHQGVVIEPERAADGTRVDTATVFLTGRECPWRCVMCDLWTHTTTAVTPRGAIRLQIAQRHRDDAPGAAMPSVIKLYNAGSFFDRRAVPPQDDDAIAEALRPFTRVVVESHPSLVGDRTWRLRDRLTRDGRTTRLEVAMGLETAHPIALERLNKGITRGVLRGGRSRARRPRCRPARVPADPSAVRAARGAGRLARAVDRASRSTAAPPWSR